MVMVVGLAGGQSNRQGERVDCDLAIKVNNYLHVLLSQSELIS